jgi:DNA-directed RNA polymerase subunit M/transcription elongation factor TFIIS
VFAEDRRELQAHIDSEAAAEVFRMLDPSYCPRCDNAIAIERKKREKISHECSVCGEHITTDENATEIKERLERSVRETESALNRARRVRNDVDVALIDIREQVSSLEETADALSKRMANFGERRRLETEVVVLEARLAEASLDLEPADDKPDYTGILDALVAETELRVKAAQAQLLRTISEKIVSYAKRFGMDALNSAELKGNVTLPLVKGGRATTYSRVTQGEKLRLKVATVLAMISVAESKGVGRHPGLLMIDSPGAQEVTRKDLEELTAGLEEVAKEFDHLQVFIAAVASDAITAHVPRERVLYARGDAPLW